jgi:hypothetical protein
MIRPVVLLCAAALLVARFAMAQPAEAQNVWNDADLVVTAHVPGIALWRVQKGDSEVVVIGILPVFPKSQAWSTRRVENALRGAHGLITPPAPAVGIGDIFGIMSSKNLPGHQPLQAVLPPDLYARYVATAARAGVSIKPFAHDKPIWAGARLRKDVLQKLALSDEEPAATIIRLAHRANVPVHSAGRIKFALVVKDVNAMSDAASRDCLADVLDDIDFDLDRAPKAAAAWAAGDIRTVHANYQGSAMLKCFQGSEPAAGLLDHSIDDSVAAIDNALKTPGKSVAIFPLATILRKDGALDRLRAQGASISSPDY